MQIDANTSEGLAIPVDMKGPGVYLPSDLINERSEQPGRLYCTVYLWHNTGAGHSTVHTCVDFM